MGKKTKGDIAEALSLIEGLAYQVNTLGGKLSSMQIENRRLSERFDQLKEDVLDYKIYAGKWSHRHPLQVAKGLPIETPNEEPIEEDHKGED